MAGRDASSGNDLEIIEFYIDETLADGGDYRSYYAMNVAKVLEIIRRPPVTGVPGKHHKAALGTFNLRGKVLPLVDLGIWLGKKLTPADTHKVIVSEFSNVVTAFVVSGVTRIHRMTWRQVEPPGKYLQAFSRDSITGVVRFEDRIVFLLDMEYIISAMDPTFSMTARVEQVERDGGQGLRVLIADDSPSIRRVIASCLGQAQYTVTECTCGREAWDQLLAWRAEAERTGVPITGFVNLVISDIEMPEMDGHALTTLIKGEAAFAAVPVILFSSLISEVVHAKGVKAGADDQVSKPDLPHLTRRAGELIRRFQG
ncbi:MAG: chemotaxis protein [Desulfovibrio sp.]|jgi:two-component system chemotaxis response regulator CheV|nr:chemotaxis protein [Desulfovibrio sp.]